MTATNRAHNVRTLAGQQACLFGSAGDYCGRPAAVHVLIGDAIPTLSCTEHVAWFVDHDCEDMHPVMELCGMPGCTWIWTTSATPGRCVIEGLAAPVVMAEAASTGDTP